MYVHLEPYRCTVWDICNNHAKLALGIPKNKLFSTCRNNKKIKKTLLRKKTAWKFPEILMLPLIFQPYIFYFH